MSQRSSISGQLFANNGRHRADTFCRRIPHYLSGRAECATVVITTGDQSICACALYRTRQLERRAATGHSDILIVNVKTNMSFSALEWVDKWTLAIYKAIRCDLKGYKGLAFTKPCFPGFVVILKF